MKNLGHGLLVIGVVSAATGCAGNSEPAQPNLTPDSIQGLREQGKEQVLKERGDRGPGGSPNRVRP